MPLTRSSAVAAVKARWQRLWRAQQPATSESREQASATAALWKALDVILPERSTGAYPPTRETLLFMRNRVFWMTAALREAPGRQPPDWRPNALVAQLQRVLRRTPDDTQVDGLACAGRQLVLLTGCYLVGIPARRVSLHEEVHGRKFEADRDPATGGVRNAQGQWVGRNHRSHSMVEARPVDQDRFTLQDAHFNCEVTDDSGRLLSAFEAVDLCRSRQPILFDTNGHKQRPYLDNDYIEREYPPHLLYRYAAKGRAYHGDEPAFFPASWNGIITYEPGTTQGHKPDTDLRASMMSPVLTQFLLERPV